MTSSDLYEDLLRKLYIEDPSALSGTILAGLQADVLSAINRAFQTIWTAPNSEHFTRKHFTFNTAGGTSSYALDATVQKILGPVKLDGATPHISPLKNRADFDYYLTRFKGQLSDSGSNARPEVYFLERLYANAAEATVVNMLLKPTPDAVYAVDFEASIEAPNFTQAQVEADTDLPMPHGYIESILLPISRWYTTRSHYFMPDKRQGELSVMKIDYEEAMRQIGLTDPQAEQAKTAPTIIQQ